MWAGRHRSTAQIKNFQSRQSRGSPALHKDDVGEFLTHDPKGKQVPAFLEALNNAKQALDARPESRRLTLRIASSEGGRVRVEVEDNGTGIARENLTRIFQHGFTTKKTGHGFGLHSGANTAWEMGGSLQVHSDGPGTGATFILELPLSQIVAHPFPRSADQG